MKTYLDLINELSEHPILRQLDALQDGEFLSQFEVSTDQVEELYSDLMENLNTTRKDN